MVKSEIFKKFYFKQWVIGLVQDDIKNIIRTKTFHQDIMWLPVNSKTHFYADPFLLNSRDGNIDIFFEDFSIEEHYGNISLMTLDSNFNEINRKILLDTESHLSFPFIFTENNRIFILPESARKERLSCYEYDAEDKSLHFLKDIVKLPLYDSAILKRDGKYWLFGTLFENRTDYKLHVFYSENLLGPYTPHQKNPVKIGLDGSRAAGNFIEVDGIFYRPTQNCQNKYGESITINKILEMNELNYSEEPYMMISIDERNLNEKNIHTIHTLNFYDKLIVVDGMKWTLSFTEQWKNFRRNRRLLRKSRAVLNSE